MKSVLTDKRYNKPFDPNLDTELLVDTSRVSGVATSSSRGPPRALCT